MSTDQLAKAPEIIVLDGHDGAGKTTLARLAAATECRGDMSLKG